MRVNTQYLLQSSQLQGLEWPILMASALIRRPGRGIWLNTALTSVAFRLVPSRLVGPSEPRAKAKICQLDVAICTNKDVVWLDVSVNEAHFMDRVNGND